MGLMRDSREMWLTDYLVARKDAPNNGCREVAMTERGVHDMGGEPGGEVDNHEHVPTMSERRVDALMQLMRSNPRSFWVVDEMRRTIESLTPEHYNASGYYEKWAYALRGLLIEKGVVSEAEMDAKLAEVKARLAGQSETP